MAASEPMVKPPEAGYPHGPITFTRGRPRGSISEARLTSAMMMATDVLAVLLALSLASLVAGNTARKRGTKSVI